MDLQIRRAGISDSALLCRLSEVTFRDAFGHTCSEEDMSSFLFDNFNEPVITKELSDPLDFYFIAICNDQPAGYMRLKEDYSEYEKICDFKALELKRIYVLKDFQGKSIGSKLLEFAIQFAQQNNFEMLWLGVWEHNEGAMKLYKTMGFTDTGDTHLFYIGENESTDCWFIKHLRNS